MKNSVVGINSSNKTRSFLCSKETRMMFFRGIVQGVGFRPFIFRVATMFDIYGTVENTFDGVKVICTSYPKNLDDFYAYILNNLPIEAKIHESTNLLISTKDFSSFSIIKESKKIEDGNAIITPDYAICNNCKKELENSADRRFNYPFITCTDCGPRFSILRSIPFDRENTSMHEFVMCEKCKHEFANPTNRRFYSQTNSCNSCGIKLEWYDFSTKSNEYKECTTEELINLTVDRILEGKIVAVKGIGGYLLLCDATNNETLIKLRSRKRRPSKPFAVMYPNLETIIKDYKVSSNELEWLQSNIAPIVLLSKKNDKIKISEFVAPHLDRVGVFLTYTPLLQLILNSCNIPLIATSANVGGETIVFRNNEAIERLGSVADHLLMNDRNIETSQDDSVIQFSEETKTKIILRMGRGLSPATYSWLTGPKLQTTLAFGSNQKSSISIASRNFIYLSQYLGNLENFETQENFNHFIEYFTNILNIKPQNVIMDDHPDYFSSYEAINYANKHHSNIFSIQHHKSHFYSALFEHDLLDSETLGCIFDGTGLGSDGMIWGGEFFLNENSKIKRVFHLEYAPILSGDKMSIKPKICALAFSQNIKSNFLKKLFTDTEWKIYEKLLLNSIEQNKIKTSSMGRLFDAVASFCGINEISYEGEAALRLEILAKQYRRQNLSFFESYSFHFNQEQIMVKKIFMEIEDDLNKNDEENIYGKIALKFHITIIKIIESVAVKLGIAKIIFSGGVFQNGLLVDLLKAYLSDKFELFFHEKISPNDENISLGQIVGYSQTLN